MTKTCDVCDSQFEAQGKAWRATRCSDKCKRVAKCRKEARYRAANRDKYKARDRRFYENNREARLEYQKQYYADNAEHIRRRELERHHAKGEERLEQMREYSMSPRGKVARAKAHAKRKGAPCNDTIKHFKKADRCVRCGATEELEVEHITPISQGGTNHIENLTTMCAECNRGLGGKHTKGPHDWATFVAWYLWREDHSYRQRNVAPPTRRSDSE